MRTTGTRVASWWLSERSTPHDVEQRLLAAGLQRRDDDYLVDGMLLTREPPAAPEGVTARAVESAEEFVAAMQTQYEAFGRPTHLRHHEAELVEYYELTSASDIDVHYAAWVYGRLAGGAHARFTPRGVHLAGGATLPWARGRGAYRALVRARWDDAVARGTPALGVSANALSGPILGQLGFVTTCQFRRLEDVLSDS